MATFSSEEGWACFQRCLERARGGADAPLVPVIGSGLHLWAGLPKQSPVTDWYELLRQVCQRLELDDFPLEALKDFPTLAWDSMMVAAARNGGPPIKWRLSPVNRYAKSSKRMRQPGLRQR